ncbi:MAG: hypothetical protein IPI26_11130 [Elusimicrobia bacterium]|nr:hypothetical protein [Elusimicrobiota bacterium]MBK8652209.1 hypothetical protein [Elusimicrobiota bacterium]
MKDIDREPFAEIFHNLSGSENDRGYSLIFDGTVVPALLTKMDAEDRAYIINAAFNKRLDEEIAKVERLRFVLKELHALVWGEAPSLLCEDSGGDALLDCKILEVLEP